MNKRRTSYRRDGKGIHADEARLRAAGLAPDNGRPARIGAYDRGTHELWAPNCIAQRLEGHQGPLCLGCEVLCDALRSLGGRR